MNRRGTYLIALKKVFLLKTFWEFPWTQYAKDIFTGGEIQPMWGQIKLNIGKLEELGKLRKLEFWNFMSFSINFKIILGKYKLHDDRLTGGEIYESSEWFFTLRYFFFSRCTFIVFAPYSVNHIRFRVTGKIPVEGAVLVLSLRVIRNGRFRLYGC